MPNYRRWRVDGGIFFFTLVTHERRKLFDSASSRRLFRRAVAEARQHYSFDLDGLVLLPDHIHVLMRLPDGENNYSRRLGAVKRNFTDAYLAVGGIELPVTAGRKRKRDRGVWQSRFYEHYIRNYRDFKRHLDYIHVNPVKHGLATWPREWRWSSFHRYVKLGWYEMDWCGHVETGGWDFGPEFW